MMNLVDLGDNAKINDSCMKSLGEFIKSNKSIEILALNQNMISDAGIEILAHYFDGNTTVRYLTLQGNKNITDKSIPLFTKMIEVSHIETIKVNKTSMTKNNDFVIPLAYNVIKYGSEKLELCSK